MPSLDPIMTDQHQSIEMFAASEFDGPLDMTRYGSLSKPVLYNPRLRGWCAEAFAYLEPFFPDAGE